MCVLDVIHKVIGVCHVLDNAVIKCQSILLSKSLPLHSIVNVKVFVFY